MKTWDQIENMKKFSFDAETEGLYGETIAISVLVEEGKEKRKYSARTNYEPKDEFLKDLVIPNIQCIKTIFNTEAELLEWFWNIWMNEREGAVCIVHVALPVKSNVIRKCVEVDIKNRMWDAPFPLIDVSAMLFMADEQADSVENYLEKMNIVVEKKARNSLYHSETALEAFKCLMSRA